MTIFKCGKGDSFLLLMAFGVGRNKKDCVFCEVGVGLLLVGCVFFACCGYVLGLVICVV